LEQLLFLRGAYAAAFTAAAATCLMTLPRPQDLITVRVIPAMCGTMDAASRLHAVRFAAAGVQCPQHFCSPGAFVLVAQHLVGILNLLELLGCLLRAMGILVCVSQAHMHSSHPAACKFKCKLGCSTQGCQTANAAPSAVASHHLPGWYFSAAFL
jgi:hypothetical protein